MSDTDQCTDRAKFDSGIAECSRPSGHEGMHISESGAVWSPGMGIRVPDVDPEPLEWINRLVERDETTPWGEHRVSAERAARRRRLEMYQKIFDLPAEDNGEREALVEELEEMEIYPVRLPYLGGAAWSVQKDGEEHAAVREDIETKERIVLHRGTAWECAEYIEWINGDSPL